MPQLNVDALVILIRNLTMEIHEIYSLEKDFGLSERLLQTVFRMENMLHTLESLQNQKKS